MDGRHPGCVEARKGFEGKCEFDGRFSLARRRITAATGEGVDEYEWFLYARANVVRGTAGVAGGRHVQVTRASSPYGPWASFQLISFEGYQMSPSQNIYFAVVNGNPVAPHTLLGLFPYYSEATRDAYIGIALTCDGWHFSSMYPLLGSRVNYLSYNAPRIQDHPVDGFVTGPDGMVYVYLHEKVPGIASHYSKIARYELSSEGLRNYTREAMRTLPSCAKEQMVV